MDMSGGSGDDATLSIAHFEEGEGKVIIDGIWDQGKRVPFDPRDAIRLFASILKDYKISHVTGDRYAGETFRADFQGYGISYEVCPYPKSVLYEALEVELNSGRITIPDNSNLIQQLLTLIMKGGKIDHASGDHDDLANAVAGAAYLSKGGVSVDINDVLLVGQRETLAYDGPWGRESLEEESDGIW